jgi:hypothetical protein
MSSDQRLVCSGCSKPWQPTHYKTCDDCRRKQAEKRRDRKAAATADRPRKLRRILPRPTASNAVENGWFHDAIAPLYFPPSSLILRVTNIVTSSLTTCATHQDLHHSPHPRRRYNWLLAFWKRSSVTERPPRETSHPKSRPHWPVRITSGTPTAVTTTIVT